MTNVALIFFAFNELNMSILKMFKNVEFIKVLKVFEDLKLTSVRSS